MYDEYWDEFETKVRPTLVTEDYEPNVKLLEALQKYLTNHSASLRKRVSSSVLFDIHTAEAKGLHQLRTKWGCNGHGLTDVVRFYS